MARDAISGACAIRGRWCSRSPFAVRKGSGPLTRTRKSPRISVTLIKKGRRKYGGIYQLPSGRQVYLAYRNLREIFRSGKATISEAVRDGSACWAIDEEHIQQMRLAGVPFVGVLVRDTKDIYVTRLTNFFDRDKIKFHNYAGRGGSHQRLLPLEHFQVRRGRAKI